MAKTPNSRKLYDQIKSQSKPGQKPRGIGGIETAIETLKHRDMRDPDATNGLLNQAQRRFAIELAKGLSQTEAARRAGYSPNTAPSTASALIRMPKVRAFYESLLVRPIGAILPTREEHAASLMELRDIAKRNGQLNAAVRAEELIGRISGYYIERTETLDIARVAQSLPAEKQVDLVRFAIKRIEELTGQRVTVEEPETNRTAHNAIEASALPD